MCIRDRDVLECLDDVSELEKCRKLFTPDDYEQLAADYKGSSRVIKADVYKRQVLALSCRAA